MIIATTLRGAVDPPEPLDEANQRRAEYHADELWGVKTRPTIHRRPPARAEAWEWEETSEAVDQMVGLAFRERNAV